MGLPRSGTTMIENLIYSSENKIIKGDETGVMGKVFFQKILFLTMMIIT